MITLPSEDTSSNMDLWTGRRIAALAGSKKKEEAVNKDNKKELRAQYKEMKYEAGIYRVINQQTGRYYLASTTDIQAIRNRFDFAQKIGSHTAFSIKMGQDLAKYGVNSFSLEILEVLDMKPDMTPEKIKGELKLLVAMWREAHSEDDIY